MVEEIENGVPEEREDEQGGGGKGIEELKNRFQQPASHLNNAAIHIIGPKHCFFFF